MTRRHVISVAMWIVGLVMLFEPGLQIAGAVFLVGGCVCWFQIDQIEATRRQSHIKEKEIEHRARHSAEVERLNK